MMPGPVFGEICLLTVPRLKSSSQISLTSDSSHYHKLLATTPRQDEVDTHVYVSSRVCSLVQVTRCLRRRCWKCTTSQNASNPSIAINVEIRTARLTTQSCAVTEVASPNGPISAVAGSNRRDICPFSPPAHEVPVLEFSGAAELSHQRYTRCAHDTLE